MSCSGFPICVLCLMFYVFCFVSCVLYFVSRGFLNAHTPRNLVCRGAESLELLEPVRVPRHQVPQRPTRLLPREAFSHYHHFQVFGIQFLFFIFSIQFLVF
jgi:hypothetical protein